MAIIRPVTHQDLPSLLQLAEKTGGGLTSLPVDEKTLSARIERSVATWRGDHPRSQQGYVFVLELPESGKIAGICGIDAAVGLEEPWYNYRVGSQVYASRQLDVYNHLATLSLSNDHTGATELCSLFLDPDHRQNKNGQLLSKSRFLFLAQFPEHFSERVVAEMRGVSSSEGESPFWDSVGHHFFSMDFTRADYLSGTGHKAFIAELMPKHPLYIHYLTPQAQQVIGQVHPDTAPARAMLESEGFRYRNYVDIFDGGPTLECDLEQIRAVTRSQQRNARLGDPVSDAPLCLVSSCDYHDFRVLIAPVDLRQPQVTLTQQQLDSLHLHSGDQLRVVTLSPKDSPL